MNGYKSNLNGSNIFGTMEICSDMGSSSHWGLIMAPVQEANSDNLGKSFNFLHNDCMLSVLIRNEAILMSLFVYLCWGFTAQSTWQGHVERSQFT